MRLSLREPVGALGFLLAFGIAASVIVSAVIGPLLVTALLTDGFTWRWVYGAFAVAQVALAWVLTMARRNWRAGLPSLAPPLPGPDGQLSGRHDGAAHRKPPIAVVLAALAFIAVETGIESGAGIWGYIFLTGGRGLSPAAAGVAVSACWPLMFAGRAVLGPVAERAGSLRLLAGAVAGMPLGAALMAVPGPRRPGHRRPDDSGPGRGPVFPLLTVTTARRMGAAGVAGATRVVTLQVAASAIGSTALPAGLGLAIGGLGARTLAPLLLVRGLAMCGAWRLMSHLAGCRISR